MVDVYIHIKIYMKVHLNRLGGEKPLELSICSSNEYRSVFINKLLYSKKYIERPYRIKIVRNHNWCERY